MGLLVGQNSGDAKPRGENVFARVDRRHRFFFNCRSSNCGFQMTETAHEPCRAQIARFKSESHARNHHSRLRAADEISNALDGLSVGCVRVGWLKVQSAVTTSTAS